MKNIKQLLVAIVVVAASLEAAHAQGTEVPIIKFDCGSMQQYLSINGKMVTEGAAVTLSETDKTKVYVVTTTTTMKETGRTDGPSCPTGCETAGKNVLAGGTYSRTVTRTQNQNESFSNVIETVFRWLIGSSDKNKFADEAKFEDGSNTKVEETKTLGPQDVPCDNTAITYEVESTTKVDEARLVGNDNKKILRSKTETNKTVLNVASWNNKTETWDMCGRKRVPKQVPPVACSGDGGTSGSSSMSGGESIESECIQAAEICRVAN